MRVSVRRVRITPTPRWRSSSRTIRLNCSVTSFSLSPPGKKRPGFPGSTPPWPASMVTTWPRLSPLASRLGSRGVSFAGRTTRAASARRGRRARWRKGGGARAPRVEGDTPASRRSRRPSRRPSWRGPRARRAAPARPGPARPGDRGGPGHGCPRAPRTPAPPSERGARRASVLLQGAPHLAVGDPALDVFAAVMGLLSLPERERHFGASTIEVHLERNQSESLLLDPADQALDFPAMHQQLARADRLRIPAVPLLVGGDVHSLEPELPIPYMGVGLLDRGLSVPKALDLSPGEDDARLPGLEQVVVVTRPRISCHGDPRLAVFGGGSFAHKCLSRRKIGLSDTPGNARLDPTGCES